MSLCRVILGQSLVSVLCSEKRIFGFHLKRNLQHLSRVSSCNEFGRIQHYSTDSKSSPSKQQAKQVCLLFRREKKSFHKILIENCIDRSPQN